MLGMTYFENHTTLGAIVTGSSILVSHLLAINLEGHIPNLVMDLCQLSVWVIGSLAGLSSLHGWYKKNIDNGKGE